MQDNPQNNLHQFALGLLGIHLFRKMGGYVLKLVNQPDYGSLYAFPLCPAISPRQAHVLRLISLLWCGELSQVSFDVGSYTPDPCLCVR
ncbi:hypothetical protein D3C72_814740 [compost metagenome]